MRSELLEPGDPRWATTLAHARHDFYHLPGYVGLSAASEAGTGRALLITDRDRAVLLPLVIRPIPGGRGFDATTPYGYPGPIRSGDVDATFLNDALRDGTRLLASEGLVSLFGRLHPLLNADLPTEVGTCVRHGDTVSVDLRLSPEELWHQTRAGHRYQINQALRAGHEAWFDDAWEHEPAFRRIYRTTMRRREAAAPYHFDDAYFDGLRRALGDRLRLCVVLIQGAVAAGGLFVETDGIVEFHLSGTDPAYASHAPSKLMLHAVRGWARERGNQSLHLGGGVGGVNDSLFEFKAGFSPLRHPFHSWRVILDRPSYERLVRERDASADPADVRDYFPLYRRP
jgi:hypothetical protein